VVNDNLQLRVTDDGRGLNLPALQRKGVRLGKWQYGDKPSAADIAQLIFESGVSTKEVVTDVSGRGVGMDAVRQFVIDCGGAVDIELTGKADDEFMPFSLVLTLPASTFFQET